MNYGQLFIITVLAVMIALGKVQQESSYGLEIVLGSLATLSGGLWAMGVLHHKEAQRHPAAAMIRFLIPLLQML